MPVTIKEKTILDAESKELTARIAHEFITQVEEVENNAWQRRKLNNAPIETRPPQNFFFKFQNDTRIGAQCFVTSVAFGAGIFLADKSYLNRRNYFQTPESQEEYYTNNLPANCSEILIITNFPGTIVQRIAKDLLEYAPVELVININETQTILEGTEATKGRTNVYYRTLARPNQVAFRAMVLAAYNNTCPITNCNIEAALEAAHIIPFAQEGADTLENGLLLRADLHRLFDTGLMAIDPDTGEVHFKDENGHYNNYIHANIPNNIRENLTAHWQKYNE